MNTEPTPPPEPPNRSFAGDAVGWARRELSADGVRRLFKVMATSLRLLRFLALPTGATAGIGAILALLLLRDDLGMLLVVVLLCVPGLAACWVSLRGLGQVARSLENPDLVVTEARSLAGNLRDSTELRELATRLGPKQQQGPIAKTGRLRRGAKTARLVSQVIGQVGPDPAQHPHLAVFVPERLGRLWWALTGLIWGGALALLAIAIALVAGI